MVELFGECLPAPATNLPSLAANADVSVAEGDTTDTNVNLTVTLTAPSTTTIRVKYYTAPLTGISSLTAPEFSNARGRADYRPISGELRFSPGETSKTLPIAVRGDMVDEFDEKFSLFLANATNARISDNQTVITILDNDLPPSIIVGNGSGVEGNTGNLAINIPLTLSTLSEKPIAVQFVTGGGTAVPNLDYVRAQGTASIPAGQTSGSITVNTIGDLTVEPDETFFVEISDPVNVTIANARGTGTIINDDVGGSVQFGSATYTGTEFSGGVQISITRTGGNGGGVSVRFRTQAGTALPGQDYTEVSTTVSFAENETSKNVFIPIISDQLDEPDETVNLIVDSPVGVTIGTPSPAILTIQNSPNIPDLTIMDASVAEGDNGITYMMFSVRLSKPTQRVVTVDYSMAPETATPGVDYISAAGTFTIRRGVTRASLYVAVVGDFMFESDETFLVNLANATNANLINSQARGRITNDEINTGSSIQFVSINRDNNASANNASWAPSISADGKVIAFQSYATDLVNNDTNGSVDIYV